MTNKEILEQAKKNIKKENAERITTAIVFLLVLIPIILHIIAYYIWSMTIVWLTGIIVASEAFTIALSLIVDKIREDNAQRIHEEYLAIKYYAQRNGEYEEDEEDL